MNMGETESSMLYKQTILCFAAECTAQTLIVVISALSEAFWGAINPSLGENGL